MHRSIRDRLESLIANRGLVNGEQEVSAHLSECHECSTELSAMQVQAELFGTLRIVEELDPAPGFYARVIQRIEERAKESMWAAFLISPFAKRLTYASLTVAVMLGTYVVTREARDGHLLGGPAVVAETHFDAPVTGSESQQRDAVLANFASYQGLPR